MFNMLLVTAALSISAYVSPIILNTTTTTATVVNFGEKIQLLSKQCLTTLLPRYAYTRDLKL